MRQMEKPTPFRIHQQAFQGVRRHYISRMFVNSGKVQSIDACNLSFAVIGTVSLRISTADRVK